MKNYLVICTLLLTFIFTSCKSTLSKNEASLKDQKQKRAPKAEHPIYTIYLSPYSSCISSDIENFRIKELTDWDFSCANFEKNDETTRHIEDMDTLPTNYRNVCIRTIVGDQNSMIPLNFNSPMSRTQACRRAKKHINYPITIYYFDDKTCSDPSKSYQHAESNTTTEPQKMTCTGLSSSSHPSNPSYHSIWFENSCHEVQIDPGVSPSHQTACQKSNEIIENL